MISSPDLVLAVRGQKRGEGKGKGENEIWQNTNVWARIWPTSQVRMLEVWLVFHVYSTVDIELDNALLSFAVKNAIL